MIFRAKNKERENMSQRRRLSDVLGISQQDALERAWQSTQAAKERSPIPAGVYETYVTDGRLFTSNRGTAGYKLEFEICRGDYAGRKVWHDLWLTPAALALSKRDLQKLGITTLDQLEQPLPQGIKCRVKIVTRQNDSGETYNVVRDFDVIGVEPPATDPFAPESQADDSGGDGGTWEVRV
jgi:hypothetical protein